MASSSTSEAWPTKRGREDVPQIVVLGGPETPRGTTNTPRGGANPFLAVKLGLSTPANAQTSYKTSACVESECVNFNALLGQFIESVYRERSVY